LHKSLGAEANEKSMIVFEQLELIPPILRALREEGYVNPTPIQAQAIPFVLDGRDLFGAAQTGTGKTAAFSLPILQILSEEQPEYNGREIRALILAPTRELAIQIGENIKAYSRYLNLRFAVIFGGVPQRPQVDAIRRGVDILVATPGRLQDLHQQGLVRLEYTEIVVLDEADRMLDMGFINDIKRIMALVPVQRQTLLFSATLPPEIKDLMGKFLKKPAHVEVSPVSTTVDKIAQSLYMVSRAEKRNLLYHVLSSDPFEQAIVFTRTKHGADKVARELSKRGIRAEALHGNKSQNNRQRTMGDFKAKRLKVLIATDIASRGIDVDDLSHVINYDLPDTPETYVHRIGRTGRAGASGKAISFSCEEDFDTLRDIQKHLKKNIPLFTDHPFHLDEKELIIKAQTSEKPIVNKRGDSSQRPKPNHDRNSQFTRPPKPKKKGKTPDGRFKTKKAGKPRI
jgi:ATP-dependent RNA helicase RhlE